LYSLIHFSLDFPFGAKVKERYFCVIGAWFLRKKQRRRVCVPLENMMGFFANLSVVGLFSSWVFSAPLSWPYHIEPWHPLKKFPHPV
jgi:hypothetical protein